VIESPVTVFNCGVFLQALLSKSAPAVRCLELIEEARIRLVLSEEILTEINDVLLRPRFRQRNQNLTEAKVESLIEMLLTNAEFVENIPKHFAYSRDPEDEPYLNLAIETEAVFLVSRDKDLLDLMADYTDEAKDFRQRFRKIRIVHPVEFLQVFEGKD